MRAHRSGRNSCTLGLARESDLRAAQELSSRISTLDSRKLASPCTALHCTTLHCTELARPLVAH